MEKRRLTLASLLLSTPYLTIMAIGSSFMITFSNAKVREYSGYLTGLLINNEEFMTVIYKIIEFSLMIIFFNIVNKCIIRKICIFLSKNIIFKLFSNSRKKKKNDTFSFFLKDITDIERYISGIFTVAFLDLFFFFIALNFIYQINIMLSFIVLLSALIPMIILMNLNKALSKVWGSSNRNFLGVNKLKGLNLNKSKRIRINFSPAMFICFLTAFITAIYGITLVKESNISLGALLSVFLLISCVVKPLTRLDKTIEIIKSGQMSIKRLNEYLLSRSKEDTNYKCNNHNTILEFKNVSYKHNNIKVLSNINFQIKEGQVLFIYGSMAGKKQYIIKLINCMINPSEGNILFYDKTFGDYNFEYLRSQISVVSKDMVLFSGTVYDNILTANPKAVENDIIQACKLAGIHNEIMNLENGYSTEIGENGYGISRKMRQELSLARAFLKDSPIVVIDDPYVLFSLNEKKKLYSKLVKLCENKTIIYMSQNKKVFKKN